VSATRPNLTPNNRWRELYAAAVLELDSTKLLQVIAEAESMIARRTTELLSDSADHFQEQRDLNDAVYGLHALRNMLRQSSAMTTSADLHRKVG
jgi:hypothetical protein